MVLPDVLEPGLRIVFCGTAAGTKSAKVGEYYAGPGNAFWPTLHNVGLTSKQLKPSEFRELLRYRLGLTDVCKILSGSDEEVGTGKFDVEGFVAKIENFRPNWVAFNGVAAAKAVLGGDVSYGPQADPVAHSKVWVLPSTSGAARRYWDIGYWQGLADAE